ARTKSSAIRATNGSIRRDSARSKTLDWSVGFSAALLALLSVEPLISQLPLGLTRAPMLSPTLIIGRRSRGGGSRESKSPKKLSPAPRKKRTERRASTPYGGPVRSEERRVGKER